MELLFVVEMAVIETASENSSTQLSTSVVVLLTFPPVYAEQQAYTFSSF